MSLNRPMGINSDVLNTKVQHINTISPASTPAGRYGCGSIRFLFSIVNYSKQSILKIPGVARAKPRRSRILSAGSSRPQQQTATNAYRIAPEQNCATLFGQNPIRPRKGDSGTVRCGQYIRRILFQRGKITDILPFCPSHPDFLVRQVPKLPGFTRFKSENEGRILAECVPPRNSYHSKLRIPTLRARGSVSSPLREPREEGHAHLLLDEADRHRDTAQFRAGAGFRTVGEGLDPETDGLQLIGRTLLNPFTRAA